jgi:hypothetical protein
MWALRYWPNPKFSEHNYLPSSEPSVYQTHHQLVDEDVAIIASLTIAGIPLVLLEKSRLISAKLQILL